MDPSTLLFTSSLDVDTAMAFYDVMGSLAHVRMLKERGIIPPEDADSIIKGLKAILDEMDEGAFDVDDSLEDIHTCVETRLTGMIGPVGGKLHTARSRNDQVATDLRMYLRDAVLEAVAAVDTLITDLIAAAEGGFGTIMPGFTHMQHAQPVTLAQHMMAHAFRLDRDAERFMDAYRRMNKCPLGSAALAGTTFGIDREMTAAALGFRRPTENSMDSVSDRDFVAEIGFCASLLAVHLSSMAEELVLWSSSEFGFVEMDDRYSTGSSIMPQKKNPDIAELVRGRAGGVAGSLIGMLMTLKGLPLSYNRDLQEDKRGIMEAMDTVVSCTSMMSDLVSTVRFDEARMLSLAEEGFMNATDLADYLVVKGLTFREAHGVVGAVVRYCISEKRRIEELRLGELKGFSDAIGKDVFDILPVARCVERRDSLGGTSSSAVDVQTVEAMASVMRRDEEVRAEAAFLERCWEDLVS